MSILLVGANGNMGKRYRAVLSYLGQEIIPVDREHNRNYTLNAAHKADGIIVATPTDTHCEVIRALMPAGKPILCEKPVTKDVAELKSLLSAVRLSGSALRMVYQYQILAERSRIGRSFYNYFKHGTDGLIWDCMQIIGLARSELQLSEDSPIWKCMINGKRIHIQDMDAAYIAYVQHWLKEPYQDLGEILEVHERTAEAHKKHIHDKRN